MSARAVLPFTVRRRTWRRFGIAVIVLWMVGNVLAYAVLCFLFYAALEALL